MTERVTFGPAPGNSIPADWAPLLLARLFARVRQSFGEELAELAAEELAGVEVKASRPRKDKP